MQSFTFLFLADCQLGCYATFSGSTPADVERFARRGMKVAMVPEVEGFEWDAARYREAIAAANRERPAFVVLGGDMVEDQSDPDQLAELMSITSELDPSVPMRWVAGNHDAAGDGVVPSPQSVEWYRSTFGPDAYSFDHGDAAFVVVDSTVLQHPEKVPGEPDRSLAQLEESLSGARRRGARHIVVFSHHPPFLEHPDEPDSYWNLPSGTRRRVVDILHRHGVRLVLSGHLHRNNTASDGGLSVVASGAVGFPLGDDPPGYRSVTVGPDGIEHSYKPLERAS